MPRLSDSMEEGTILKWLVADGDEVARGDEIAEIETDKANMTYEADAAGVLRAVAAEGDTLPIGAVIALLLDSAGGAGGSGPREGANGGAAAAPAPVEPASDDAAEAPAPSAPAGRPPRRTPCPAVAEPPAPLSPRGRRLRDRRASRPHRSPGASRRAGRRALRRSPGPAPMGAS